MPSRRRTDLAMIGRAFGHYRIVGRLGAGGMGEVYQARDEHLGREVAVKLLPAGTFDDDAARRRFRKEAEALSRLNHPHIATVYDFDTEGGVDFLVMEYVAGEPLSERLGRGPLSEPEVLALGADVAAALEEAHDRGVVHRDLKPANVMVTPRGRAKVLDFGLARLGDPAGDRGETMSDSGLRFAGTLPYMAPEQVRGDAVDARTDLYALGVVLFEMATGKRPFDEPHSGRLTDAILHAPLLPPSRWQPRLSGELERIIVKCLDRNPEHRYQSAKEVGIDLRRLAAPAASVPTMLPAAVGRRVAPRLVVPGLALAALLGAVAFWVAWRAGPDAVAPDAPGAVDSLVALPSRVFGADSDRFLTDAIPNTISAHLAQVKGLDTKVPPTSVEMERVAGDLGTIAAAYGVGAFVLSSVTAEPDRFVLNVQLVEARSRRLLWSRDFEGRRSDYLALAREAAEHVRTAVRPDAAGVTTRSGTTSSEAELAYQRGLYHSNRYNNQHEAADFDTALAAFQRALEIEPNLAAAAAEIGWLHEFRLESGAPVEQMLPEMERWGHQAVRIDERSGRGWSLLAFSALVGPSPDPRRAVGLALRGAAHAPRDPFPVNALGTALWGTTASLALACMEEAMRLDPLYLYPPLNRSELLMYLGRHQEALEQVDRVLRLEPGMPIAVGRKALALIELGRARDAATLIPPLERYMAERRVAADIVEQPRQALALAEGAPEARRKALDLLTAWALNPSPFAEYPRVYVWLIRNGRTNDALVALERRVALWRVPYDFLRLTPEFAPLAGQPGFERVLATARAQFVDVVGLLEDARGRGERPAFLGQPLAELLKNLGPLPARAGAE